MKTAVFLLSLIATSLATLSVVTWSQLRQQVVTLDAHVAALQARVEASEKVAGEATAELQAVKTETARLKQVDVTFHDYVSRTLLDLEAEMKARLGNPTVGQ